MCLSYYLCVLRHWAIRPLYVVAGKILISWRESEKSLIFSQCDHNLAATLGTRLMADDQLRYLMEHAEDLVPVLYDHARKLAARKYGWRDGRTLPLGKTPEEIVTDVYVSYVKGDGTEGQRIKGVRHFNSEKDLMLQLKGSIRSTLWALSDKSSTKNELVARTEEEAARPLGFESTEATPAESVESADFAKAVVEAVNAHPKITANKDLQDLIAAFDLDVTEVEGQAEMLGKKSEQISQLRYQLKGVILGVTQELNMNQKTI